MPDTPREPRRPMDKQFAQGWATSVVQDHCTAEEVKEHLTAERAINDEQAPAAEKLVRAHRSLKEVHSAARMSQ